MSSASGLRVSSSLASGSTGIQIVTAPSPASTRSLMPAAYSAAGTVPPRPNR